MSEDITEVNFMSMNLMICEIFEVQSELDVNESLVSKEIIWSSLNLMTNNLMCQREITEGQSIFIPDESHVLREKSLKFYLSFVPINLLRPDKSLHFNLNLMLVIPTCQ